MIHSCTLGLLVESTGQNNDVLALWPDSAATGEAAIDAAREAIGKQRMHLTPQGDGALLAYPIKMQQRFWGVVVIQITHYDAAAMKAIVRLLDWGITWLQFILFEYDTYIEGALAEKNSQHAAGQTGPAQILNLLNLSLKERSTEESAIGIVNFIASHFGLDRVSIGLCRGKKLELQAVSFSANFDSRTLPMQNIHNAMHEALQQRQSIHLSSAQVDGANGEAITRNHQILLNSHQLHSCHSFILRHEGELLGVLTVENAKNTVLSEENLGFIEKCCRLLASIFYLRSQAQQGIVGILRRKFASGITRIVGSKHPIEKVFAACALLFFIALFIPAEFHINNDATIESINKHLLVAPYEGFIGAIHVHPGDVVQTGQMLAQLKDDDLKLERRKLSSQLQQYRLEHDNALANGNRAQAAILNAQVEQSRIALKLVEQRLERTQLKSPIDGVVVSDDISQSLGAPVKQGDVLFEIADSSSYRVALYVDERNIGFLNTEQHGELSLKSLPGDRLSIKIDRITPLSEVREGHNFFRVLAQLDNQEQQLRPGMNGSAKIRVDKRRLAWIWFHDIWDWLRLTLWF